MDVLLKRYLKAVVHLFVHLKRGLWIFIVILSLVSLAWVAQQYVNEVTVRSACLSSNSYVAVKSPQSVTRAAVERTRTDRRRLFVRIPGSSARLGNRMFAHAALLGLAADTGLQATIAFSDDRDILNSIFNLTTCRVTEVRRAHMRMIQGPWRTAVYVPPPKNLTAGAFEDDDFVLIGYFQSWRYFQGADERVRAEFRFRKHVADAATRVLSQLTAQYRKASNNLVLVGIHVRRSDMALDYHLRRGYTVADEHYIRRAMNYVADRVTTQANGTATSLLFIVCSDDIGWARLNIRNTSYPVVFASSLTRKAEVDLAVLASCDHVITTVGTFSWWAGYLHRPDGITVYYAGFPKSGTEIGNDFHAEDFFPPGWIGLL